MPFGVGPAEILILLIVALIVFGPKRLPEMGRSLGRGMREFKESISGYDAAPEPAEKPSPAAEPTAPRPIGARVQAEPAEPAEPAAPATAEAKRDSS